MDSSVGLLQPLRAVSSLIFVILALVVLYYLYKFLFSKSGLEGTTVLSGVKPANPDVAYITRADSLPAIYEGGEYSLNFWIYINDYAINRGMNKHVISIGGSSFLTLAVFLGPYKNSLQVRVQTTANTGTVQTANSPNPNPMNQPDDLRIQNLPTIFGTLQTEGSLLSTNKPCDISSIDLQKWVQVTIILNNKTCDVFLDGKLARSCILPSFYKVDRNGLTLNVCDYKGFGGFVSNVSAYNYALNPEQVWRMYMSGPGQEYSLGDYLKSLFDPKALGALEYPKQN